MTLLIRTYLSLLIIICTCSKDLYAQKSISFGGQYSAIFREHSSISHRDHHLFGLRQYEFEQKLIEAPGLLLVIQDSSRWQKVISIVALEFDYSTILTGYEAIRNPQQLEYRGYDVGRAYIQGEYSLRYRMLNDSKYRFQPYIGFSVEPIAEYVKVIPYISNEHEWSEMNLSIALTTVFEGRVRLNNRISLSLSGHLWLGELYYENWSIESPTLNEEERENSKWTGVLDPKKYRGSLTIFYKL